MKTLWKWIAKVLFYFLSIGLFVYAASRSYDFIAATLPPDQQILGYLGLLATGGGAVAWLAVFLFSAKGTGQKGLSLLFVVIDLLGEFALFTFDTLYRSGESGMIAELAPDEIRMVVLGLSVLIAANIAASFAFHLMDPETSKRMKEESARDTLDNEVLQTIEDKAPQLAQQMAPAIAAQWEADFVQRFSNPYALGIGNLTTHQDNIIEAKPKAKVNGVPSWMIWRKKAQKPATTTYEATADVVADDNTLPCGHSKGVRYPYNGIGSYECVECGQPYDKHLQPIAVTENGGRPEYALPCGHTQGAGWNKHFQAHICNVCGEPFDLNATEDAGESPRPFQATQ